MPEPGIKRSETHYHATGNIVLLVENELFSLCRHSVMDRCQIIQDCMSMPDRDGTGDSDDKPLVLQSILLKDFVPFLDYLFPKLTMKEFSLDELESILKMSNLYGAALGRQFAIEEISKRWDVDPAQLLRMSCEHRVGQWFKPNYRRLVSPYFTMPAHQVETVGLPMLKEMIVTADRLAVNRRSLACRMSSIGLESILPLCATPVRCRIECVRYWKENAEMEVLGAMITISLVDVLRRIVTHKDAELQTVCRRCVANFVTCLEIGVADEDKIFDEEADRVYRLQGFFEAGDQEMDPNM